MFSNATIAARGIAGKTGHCEECVKGWAAGSTQATARVACLPRKGRDDPGMMNEAVSTSIQMIVFDVAGTTVRDEGDAVARAVVSALAFAGVDATVRDVDLVMGIPKPLAIRQLMTHGRGSPPEDGEVERVHEHFRDAMIQHYRSHDGVAGMPGAERVFRVLRESGVKVTLDTGFDRGILEAILERLGWHDLLDATIASDEVAEGRPAPLMINALMRTVGVEEPAAICKVGDSVSDMEEGLNAGCGLVVAMLNERTRPALPGFPMVRGIASLEELPAMLAPATAAPQA